MKLFFIIERASMLITSGTEQDPTRKHFFTVLTNPWDYRGENRLIMVSLSSIKNHRFDDTCIIKPEDSAHEFIRVDSFVDYSKARLQEAASIDRGISSGEIVEQGTIDADCFERMKIGLKASPRTPQYIQKAYDDYLSR